MLNEFSDSLSQVLQHSVQKREKTGKMSDLLKKLRATTHETGEDCKCSRFNCFQVISAEERNRIIFNFNHLGDYNAQNRLLSGLVTVNPVKRRRNRKDVSKAKFHTSSYSYHVGAHVDGIFQDVKVCQKAFISLHGITNRRVQTITKNLREFGESKDDGRGKHSNRPKKLQDETKSKIMDFINALLKSHYCLKDTSRMYLPEQLDIAKLHRMYNDSNKENKVGYTTFREIFDSNFDISFGYPNEDTYSSCDVFKGEISVEEENIASCKDTKTEKIIEENGETSLD